jgi:hypothetical protein
MTRIMMLTNRSVKCQFLLVGGGMITYKSGQIYVDAADPTRSISAAEAKSLIRKLASGFHVAGVRHGDCVCVHAFNDVSSS